MTAPERVATKRVAIRGVYGLTHAINATWGGTWCGKSLKSTFAFRYECRADEFPAIVTACPECVARLASNTPKPYRRR